MEKTRDLDGLAIDTQRKYGQNSKSWMNNYIFEILLLTFNGKVGKMVKKDKKEKVKKS